MMHVEGCLASYPSRSCRSASAAGPAVRRPCRQRPGRRPSRGGTPCARRAPGSPCGRSSGASGGRQSGRDDRRGSTQYARIDCAKPGGMVSDWRRNVPWPAMHLHVSQLGCTVTNAFAASVTLRRSIGVTAGPDIGRSDRTDSRRPTAGWRSSSYCQTGCPPSA